jgi:hypothetical protein
VHWVAVQRVDGQLLAVVEDGLRHDGPWRHGAGAAAFGIACLPHAEQGTHRTNGVAAAAPAAIGARCGGWRAGHPAGQSAPCSPGVTTCLLVRMMPRCLSTMKPVAYEDPAGSVSNALVCVTLRAEMGVVGDPSWDPQGRSWRSCRRRSLEHQAAWHDPADRRRPGVRVGHRLLHGLLHRAPPAAPSAQPRGDRRWTPMATPMATRCGSQAPALLRIRANAECQPGRCDPVPPRQPLGSLDRYK